MNSYHIIKNGLRNESFGETIIDELQQSYPQSDISNLVSLIDNTKKILEPIEKILPSEMKSNYFLVKSNKEYIDIESGRKFKPFIDLTYSKCHHGLCKKYDTLVLKNIVKNKNANIPNVVIATTDKQKEYDSIKINFEDNNKKPRVWEFNSFEIRELLKGIDEGLDEGLNEKVLYKRLAIKLSCPRETIPKLIRYIKINESKGRKNGNNQIKTKRKRSKSRNC